MSINILCVTSHGPVNDTVSNSSHLGIKDRIVEALYRFDVDEADELERHDFGLSVADDSRMIVSTEMTNQKIRGSRHQVYLIWHKVQTGHLRKDTGQRRSGRGCSDSLTHSIESEIGRDDNRCE